MEDVHVVAGPGSWSAPSPHATFLGVYDGHGGRRISDYLEDHLAENVAKEWTHAEKEDAVGESEKDQRQSRKRRFGGDSSSSSSSGCSKENNSGNQSMQSTKSNDDNQHDDQIIQTALERAFLLTDIQSRMDGVTTSGATVACCVVIPNFSSDTGNITSISIHAANAGDARAVLSSRTARPLSVEGVHKSVESSSNNVSRSNTNNTQPANPKLASNDESCAVRITHDHKSTDPQEIDRIESAGGVMIRGRVLGVLAVARSLGDHGLKEYVIGRPYLSSTEVRIIENDEHGGNSKSGLKEDEAGSNTKEMDEKENTAQSSLSLAGPYTDGEFLIVACDGLWDVMEDQEAVDFVRSQVNSQRLESREEVASLLIELAMKRRSTDNITVIVYWL